jgi:tetratricopeptide (TPR) repeat protein
VLLATKGKLEEAKTCFLRALELNPNYPDAKGNLTVLIKQDGKAQEGAHPES